MKRRKRWREALPASVEAGRAEPRREEPGSGGRGEALDPGLRRRLENLLDGADLSEVRLHRDREAEDATSAAGAHAMTRGRDVYFSPGAYAPETRKGLETLAHEVAHAVQAGSARRRPGAEPSGGALEAEAREVGRAVAAGRAARVERRAAAAGLMRQEEEAPKPSVSVHAHEITPAHGRGTIQAGTFSIAFRYELSEGETILVLSIPEGVEASFAALGEVEGGLTVDDPGGSGARTVRIAAPTGGEAVSRVRARFSLESLTHLVVFQFPA